MRGTRVRSSGVIPLTPTSRRAFRISSRSVPAAGRDSIPERVRTPVCAFLQAPAKENFVAVEKREVLEKLAALPVSTWNYEAQGPATRHVGPVAGRCWPLESN